MEKNYSEGTFELQNISPEEMDLLRDALKVFVRTTGNEKAEDCLKILDEPKRPLRDENQLPLFGHLA